MSAAQRVTIELSNDTKDMLVGLLLGDAHLSRRSLTANSRLIYAQTTKHKEYFEHVYEIFKPFCVENHKVKESNNLDKRNKETYISLKFATMQLPCFNPFLEMFYDSNVKRVPYNINELLTPRGLAYWIMDDGSKQGKGLHISCYAFTENDVDRLMFTLQDKFDIKCSIHYNIDKKPRIYIFKESMDNLKTLTSRYFIKEMLYKINM